MEAPAKAGHASILSCNAGYSATSHSRTKTCMSAAKVSMLSVVHPLALHLHYGHALFHPARSPIFMARLCIERSRAASKLPNSACVFTLSS